MEKKSFSECTRDISNSPQRQHAGQEIQITNGKHPEEAEKTENIEPHQIGSQEVKDNDPEYIFAEVSEYIKPNDCQSNVNDGILVDVDVTNLSQDGDVTESIEISKVECQGVQDGVDVQTTAKEYGNIETETKIEYETTNHSQDEEIKSCDVQDDDAINRINESNTEEKFTDALLWKYNALKDRLSSFSRITSAHAWRNINDAKSVLERMIWFLIAFVVTFIIVKGVSEITIKFFSYPTEDSLYNREEQVIFPSVTVCPFVPHVVIGKNSPEQYFPFRSSEDSPGLPYKLAQRLLSNERYVEHIEDLQHVYRLKTYSDVILECRFNGEECNENDFAEVTIARYGNCYTFQTNSSERFQVRQTRPDVGLTLILFSQSYSPLDEVELYFVGVRVDDKFKAPTSSDGIRIAVHAPNTIPDPVKKGIDISPGRFTSIGISQDVRTLLPHGPYRKCADGRYNSDMPYTYTMDLCLQQCEYEHMIKRCGCTPRNAPIRYNRNATNVKVLPCGKLLQRLTASLYGKNCNSSWTGACGVPAEDFKEIHSIIECEEEVSRMISKGEEMCGCKRQCTEIVYTPLIHATPWPHEKYYKGLNRRNFLRFMRRHPIVESKLKEDRIGSWFDNRHFTYFCYIVHSFYSLFSPFPPWQLYYTPEYPYLKCPSEPSLTPSDNWPIINKYAVINKIIEKNFLKVNIYYRSLTVNKIAEEPSYPFNKWLSELGGIIGMYAGMSAVSIVELVYILTALVFTLLCKYRN